MVIESGSHVILVDPMLGPKGSQPTFTYFRYKARRNPVVDLPADTNALLEKVTHCLITHKHPDHIDKAGEEFLIERNIPTTCSELDNDLFSKKGLPIEQTLGYEKPDSFLGGEITGIPARHGYGYVAKPMGNVMGFFIRLPGEPSLYLSSDTIYTQEVKNVLKQHQPDIAVVAAGSARLDLFKPLLMNVEDVIRFCHDAPGRVIANHLEAVNHCPTTRTGLKERLGKEGLGEKVAVPEDGESLNY